MDEAAEIRLIDEWLSRVVRGEAVPWPSNAEPAFETRLAERSRHHGVDPLVHWRLSAADWSASWPEPVRQMWRESALRAAARDLLLRNALDRVFAAFEANDIRCLLLKGAALAESIYEQSSLRTRSDTDLFIDLGDIEPAQRALRDTGFTIDGPVYSGHQFTAVGQGDARGVAVDVHWRIQNAARFARTIGFGDAWSRSVPAAQGALVRRLDDVDALIVACMHRLGNPRHDPDRLIWLYDIHLLASSFGEDAWNALEQRGVAMGVERTCGSGLSRSRARFGTVIPERFGRWALPESDSGTGADTANAGQLNLLMADIRELRGIRSRAALLGELAIPPAATLLEQHQKQSRGWLPLLYLHHWTCRAVRRLSRR